MLPPKWAQDLTLKALIALEREGEDVQVPEIRWRRRSGQKSSGSCLFGGYIVITAGANRLDAKLLLLHELAHWVTNEHHTAHFWDIAWQLYREFKLPMLYCKRREGNYKTGALVAYHRNKHRRPDSILIQS